MGVYLRTFRYFYGYWWQTLSAVMLTLVTIGLNLLKPWPFKYIVDWVLTPSGQEGTGSAHSLVTWMGWGAQQQVLILCGVLVGIHLMWGLVNLGASFLFLRIGLLGLLRLRTELYAYLQSLPLKFHDSRRSADSVFRVAYDSQSIQTIFNKGFASVFTSLITLFGAMGVMLAINWVLTLVSLAILPLVVIAIRFFANRVRDQSTAIQERESALLTLAQEGLSSIRMVHAFAREPFEIRQFRKRATSSLEANLRLNVTSVTSALVVGTLMALGTALLYAVGSLQVLDRVLTLGDLIVFASYIVMLYQPLEQLSYTAWALEGATSGAKRCFEILDSQNDVPELPGASKVNHAEGTVAFHNVRFGYSSSRSILQDISFSVKPGETLAIVGGTGSGKSTLLSLVPRFYDPDEGEVLLDGLNLKTITKKSLRQQISMVLQDTLLFSTSIRENIAYGRPGASFEEIVEAARQAQAYEFISQLPEGFDSLVGERGAQLSVGQRQRIGIARAFLKNAPILLLDEPTSALDPATEYSIMEAIEKLMRGRTTLIVTHRLATVHQMGRIVVLKDGRVAEMGSGEELLARDGIYAQLYRAGRYGGA